MKITLFQHRNYWMLKRDDQPHRIHVIKDDEGTYALLAFLGLAEFKKGSWEATPVAGEYEL